MTPTLTLTLTQPPPPLSHSSPRPSPAILPPQLFLCLTLLAYIEALHYACVACEKWDHSIFANYPRAERCHALVDTPKKLKKFLVGRQFFVIFVVFLIAQLTSFPDIPKDFAGLPPTMVLILLQTGLPGVALTLTYGQLISQIFVEQFPVEFLNLYGTEFVIRLCLGTEALGICHWAWFLYHVTSRMFYGSVMRAKEEMKTSDGILTTRVDENEPMSPTAKNRGPDHDDGVELTLRFVDIVRYVLSAFVTIAAIVIVCYGIVNKSYVLPVEPGGAFAVVIIDLTLLYFLEGLMICIVETQYWDPETFKDAYPRAYKIHKLLNKVRRSFVSLSLSPRSI